MKNAAAMQTTRIITLEGSRKTVDLSSGCSEKDIANAVRRAANVIILPYAAPQHWEDELIATGFEVPRAVA
ncbi:hypothetical protein G6L37_05760 [Agrobacterium rubi]|nr:hypothetical protein [Agrobacterium rubi]NTF24865.1 hypothetical protein [Agrobacterium rubi]